MKITAFFILFFIFPLLIFSQEDPNAHPPEAWADFCKMYSPTQNDFHSFAIICTGFARYYTIGADMGYVLQKYQNGQWILVIDKQFYSDDEPNMTPTWQGFDGVLYPGEYAAPFGNGQFRVKLYVYSYQEQPYDYDETDWDYGSVYDVVAPSTPSNFQANWSGSHPKLTWNASPEVDVEFYKIYKMIVGETGWANVANVSKNTTQWIDTDVSPAGKNDPQYTIKYKIRAVDYTNNASGYTAERTVTGTTDTFWKKSSDSDDEQILSFKLFNNYPNPFNPTTQIEFNVPHNSFVNLSVYNSLGEKVSTLVNTRLGKGNYVAEFNATNLPSGVYFYELKADNFRSLQKMILTK